MAVRPATPADARAIARVQVRTWQVAYRGQLPDELLDGLSIDDREASWTSQLADDRLGILVATEGTSGVTGFVTVGPSRDDDPPPGTGELYALYVLPDCWGRGTGRALHDAGLAWLVGHGCTRATLWVLASNRGTRRIYEHWGWTADGAVRTEQRGDAELRQVRYARHLARQDPGEGRSHARGR